MIPLIPKDYTLPEQHLKAALPRGFLARLWGLLDNSYPIEYRKIMSDINFKPGMILLPHQRRARIETELPLIAHEFGLFSTTEPFPNTKDTFVLIHLSENVKLIVCYVRNRGDAVRYAVARERLAREHNDLYVLPPSLTGITLLPETVFAILAHSPRGKDRAIFGAADIVIPTSTGELLGCLSLQDEMEIEQLEEAQKAKEVTRKVEIKIKKGS